MPGSHHMVSSYQELFGAPKAPLYCFQIRFLYGFMFVYIYILAVKPAELRRRSFDSGPSTVLRRL